MKHVELEHPSLMNRTMRLVSRAENQRVWMLIGQPIHDLTFHVVEHISEHIRQHIRQRRDLRT